MILRSTVLRHGRQVLSSPLRRSCLRTLSTDGQQPPLPTAFAEPPPPPPTHDASSAATGESSPEQQAQEQPEQPQPLWQHPGLSPMARWNRKQRVRVDPRPAEAYRRQVALRESTGHMGSVVTRRFEPAALLRDPPRPEDVTLELLMASQAHMGHHTALWNPANSRYIYGVRDGIHVISLEETAAQLRRAARVVEEVAYLGGLMLFVGTRRGQMEIVARAAELAGACHLFTKWVPGTITNRDQILGREELRMVDERDEPVAGFERLLLDKRPLMPELVVVLNPLENYVLLHECAQENIPTIGLIDTDADPMRVTYTIPGNDDSLRAVSVIAGVLGRAGEQGQKRRKADARKGLCTWRNPPDVTAWLQEVKAKEEAEKGGLDEQEGAARRPRKEEEDDDDEDMVIMN